MSLSPFRRELPIPQLASRPGMSDRFSMRRVVHDVANFNPGAGDSALYSYTLPALDEGEQIWRLVNIANIRIGSSSSDASANCFSEYYPGESGYHMSNWGNPAATVNEAAFIIERISDDAVIGFLGAAAVPGTDTFKFYQTRPSISDYANLQLLENKTKLNWDRTGNDASVWRGGGGAFWRIITEIAKP